MSPQGAPQKSNTTTVVIVLLAIGGLSLVCCVGTFGAIALPNFIHYSTRAKQSEVKANLKGAWTTEKAWLAEKDTYSESFEEMGFIPEPRNRYRYVLSPSGETLLPGAPDGGMHGSIAADRNSGQHPDNAALLAAIPPALLAEAGVHGKCPEACRVTLIGVGNLDDDPEVDLWSISSDARTIDGVSVPAGQPYQHQNDIR
jgi:type IV pilus assembly protein PilA